MSTQPVAGPYRPPQWSSGPAMVSITQVITQTTHSTPTPITSSAIIQGQSTSTSTTQTTYVFDAVLELEHEQRLEKTRHPVQTGAAISSHAYLLPARVAMYIGMSDAMDAYSNGQNNTNSAGSASPDTVSPFTGASNSKSVNAYQTMISLQTARQPLTVTTRLRTYTNMIVTAVSPHEDYKTITGLRMRVEFEQIFMASTVAGGSTVASQPAITARPDTALPAGLGQVNPSAVPSITQKQFQYPPPAVPGSASEPITGFYYAGGQQAYYQPATASVPGAGTYSSVAGQPSLLNSIGKDLAYPFR